MANPYQDVIDWLGSHEGEIWVANNFKGAYNAVLYNFKDDEAGCYNCENGIEHSAGYKGARTDQDGPDAEWADQWLSIGHAPPINPYVNIGEWAREPVVLQPQPLNYIEMTFSPYAFEQPPTPQPPEPEPNPEPAQPYTWRDYARFMSGSMTGRLRRHQP